MNYHDDATPEAIAAHMAGSPHASSSPVGLSPVEDTTNDGSNQEKWDRRFLELAALVASWSKDPSTKCGAVIVRPDRSVASVGFNGFPRGVHDLEEHYNDRSEKYERVIHSEVNAILASHEPLNGYTMYTFPAGPAPSCARCTTCVIQAGIKRVVHFTGEFQDDKPLDGWRAGMARSLDMYRMAGVEVVGL